MGLKIFLALAVLGGSATAAPLASMSADADGDGQPDAIEVSADGALHVGARTLPLVRDPQKARVSLAGPTGAPLVLVELTTATEHVAIVAAARGARLTEVARAPIGGIGLDADYGYDIEAAETGVYRYQTRPDIRRCDGKPVYLFPEKLDARTGKFAPTAIEPDVDAAAPLLPAHVDAAPADAPLVYAARAASSEPGAADASALAIPHELDDGKLDTFWRTGRGGDDGSGELFTFEARVAEPAGSLRIVPGNARSVADLKKYNRVRALAIVTAKGAWRVELPDAGTEAPGTAYTVELPAGISGCVTVVLAGTYGRPTHAAAIAELQIFAAGERGGGGVATLAHAIATGSDGATAAAAVLAKRGAAGAAALDAELSKTSDADARRRLALALAKIKDPAAAAPLVRAATGNWVRGRDLAEVIEALGALGQAQALHDLAADQGLDLEARIAAAGNIDATGPGRALLVELAGAGPRELRRAVMDRLARAPADALAKEAAAATKPAQAGDVWRAAVRSARKAPELRATVLAALLAALPQTTDYERRYRLVDGIATLGDAAALATLDAMLRALPPDAVQTAPAPGAVASANGAMPAFEIAAAGALKQVAIGAIAAAPRPAATNLVIALSRDGDPGVRIAALGALGTSDPEASTAWHAADGPDAIDRVIDNALGQDAWPEVRRRAASALSARCQRPAPATALRDAVGKDPDLGVRIESLGALVACQAPGIAAVLEHIWNSDKSPLALRQRAIDAAPALGDPALGPPLVAAFGKWRGSAMDHAESLALAQSAAPAIARLRAPGAAAALLAALDDDGFPEIVTAAALALGALGPDCPPTAKARLLALSRTEADTATAARRAAAQCGRH